MQLVTEYDANNFVRTGSVALSGFYHGGYEETLEIWVMDEFDDGWTKHLSVFPELDQEVDIH